MKRILTILFMACTLSAHAANPDMITATNIAKVVTTNAVLTGDVTKAAGATTTVLAAGNAANLNSGTLSAARLPALTGAITTSAGSAATSLGSFSSANLLTALTDETGSGLAVFGTSPTIVTPTIASFANANHTHQNSAGGGVLDAAAIANGTLSDARLSSVLQNLAGTDGSELTHLNASAIDAGTLAAARGGAGTVNGVLRADGAGNVSAATAAQVNALFPGNVLTNGNSFSLVLSNNVFVDSAHSLTLSNTLFMGSGLNRIGNQSTRVYDLCSYSTTLSLANSGFVIEGTSTITGDANGVGMFRDSGGGLKIVRSNGGVASTLTNLTYYNGFSENLTNTGNIQSATLNTSGASTISGLLTVSSGITFGTDLPIRRKAAASLQLGVDAASAISQTLGVMKPTGSDRGPADFTIAGGQGSGEGAEAGVTNSTGNIIFQTAGVRSSGSTAQVLTNQVVIDTMGNLRVLNGGIIRQTSNGNAPAGALGEYTSSLVALGSAVSLTTATAANVTSISLTAGDWDVRGNVNFNEAGVTITETVGGISSTSATIPTDGSEVYSGAGIGVAGFSSKDSVTLPSKRMSLSATTTVYLTAKCTFSLGTIGAYGSITARRVQ